MGNNIVVNDDMGREKDKKQVVPSADAPTQAAPTVPADARMNDPEYVKSFVKELLAQNADLMRDLMKEAANSRLPYNPKTDVPNPNIPQDRYINGGKKLLLPLQHTVIAPYSVNGNVQPHPHGKTLIYFAFSHDTPAMRDGKLDMIHWCSYTTYDTAELEWCLKSNWGAALVVVGDKGVAVGGDANLTSAMMSWSTHYGNMPLERVIAEANSTPGVVVSDNIDSMRAQLVQLKMRALLDGAFNTAAKEAVATAKEHLMTA